MRSWPTKRPAGQMSKVLTPTLRPRTMPRIRMNPFPRFVAIVLFVVLVALVALLAVPVWRSLGAHQVQRRENGVSSNPAMTSSMSPNTARALQLSQRTALILAGTALALAAALILGQPSRA